jgi:hypothetical protein
MRAPPAYDFAAFKLRARHRALVDIRAKGLVVLDEIGRAKNMLPAAAVIEFYNVS